MVQENRSVGYKARTEPENMELLEAAKTKQEEGRCQREPTDGLESQHGTVNVGPTGCSQREASGRQCGTIDGSNRWNAVIRSGWG